MADKNKEEVEIDLLALGKKLWDNKKFILKCSVIGAIIGIVIAFSIPKEYTSTVILTTGSQRASSNMGTLASMAGINLGNTTSEDVFPPELYPDVISSTPFIQGLLNIKVVDQKQGIDTTLYSYLKDHQHMAWWSYVFQIPSTIIKSFSSNEKEISNKINNRSIPKEKMNVIEYLKVAYSVTTDKKTAVTTVEFTSQSPIISAFIADTLTSYLQTYIIEQKTKKAKINLRNSEKLYQQARIDYYKSQQDLATFADANMNVISAKYRINQEKLQNEASIAYSLYNQMAQQVQMDKIKVQNTTPVFTVIQPSIEPLYPAKPKKKVIVIGLIFVTLMGSCSWVLIKEYFGLK